MGQKLHAYLKTAREKANLTQPDVAHALGYSTAQFVCNWERDVCHPPLDRFIELAKLFKIDIKELEQVCIETFVDEAKQTLDASFYGKKLKGNKSKNRNGFRLKAKKPPPEAIPLENLPSQVRTIYELHLEAKRNRYLFEEEFTSLIGKAFFVGSSEKIRQLIIEKYCNLDTLLALSQKEVDSVYNAFSDPRQSSLQEMQDALQILILNYR